MSCVAEEDFDPGTLSLQSLNFDKVRPLSELLGVSPAKARQERNLHTVKTLQVILLIFFCFTVRKTSFTLLFFSVANSSTLMCPLLFAKYWEEPILKGFVPALVLIDWTLVPETDDWIALGPLEEDWPPVPITLLTMKYSRWIIAPLMPLLFASSLTTFVAIPTWAGAILQSRM